MAEITVVQPQQSVQSWTVRLATLIAAVFTAWQVYQGSAPLPPPPVPAAIVRPTPIADVIPKDVDPEARKIAGLEDRIAKLELSKQVQDQAALIIIKKMEESKGWPK